MARISTIMGRLREDHRGWKEHLAYSCMFAVVTELYLVSNLISLMKRGSWSSASLWLNIALILLGVPALWLTVSRERKRLSQHLENVGSELLDQSLGRILSFGYALLFAFVLLYGVRYL